MDTAETTNYKTILDTIRQWPPNRRFALVQDVLSMLALEVTPSQPKRKTLEEALGLLATGQPTPTDVEIHQWLNEHRMEKYG